ncbi:MAG: extracellular solute-binding protein [Thaumarchaeota archaeon]|nr:extracellular solute-binding protein [Nitrososphaerota archaeon]
MPRKLMDKASLGIAVVALIVAAAGVGYTSMAISPISNDITSIKTDLAATKQKADQALAALQQTQQELGKAQQELQKAQEFQKVVEAARKEGTMVYYGHSDTPQVVEQIWPKFQEKYPWAKLQYLELGSSELATRFVSETRSGAPTADVVDITGIPGGNLAIFMKEGLLAQYKSQYIPLYPPGLIDPNGNWAGKTASYVVLNYNTKILGGPGQPPIPKTWADLSNPAYKGLIIIQEPGALSVVGQLFLQQSKSMGSNWETWLKGVAANTRAQTGSATAAYTGVVSGEYAITVDQSNDVANAAPGTPVAIAPIKEVGISLTGTGIYSKAAHPNLARLYIDWLTSPDGQRAWVATGRTTPLPSANLDAKGFKVVKAAISDPTYLPPDALPSDYATNTDKYRTLFNSIFAPGR